MDQNKKNSAKKNEAKPMPSLIFNEGILQDSEQDKALNTEFEPEQIFSKGYDPKAKKLMWFGVIFITLIIFGLWAWSLSIQWSSATWASEKNLMETTKESWDKAFATNEPTSDDLKNEVKENLKKLMVGSPTSTAETVNFPTSSPATTTILN